MRLTVHGDANATIPTPPPQNKQRAKNYKFCGATNGGVSKNKVTLLLGARCNTAVSYGLRVEISRRGVAKTITRDKKVCSGGTEDKTMRKRSFCTRTIF